MGMLSHFLVAATHFVKGVGYAVEVGDDETQGRGGADTGARATTRRAASCCQGGSTVPRRRARTALPTVPGKTRQG